ncbi:MAG: M50 family metallopeptidase, partial [Acidimicrobiia bacterium]
KEDRETGGLLKLNHKTTAGLIGVQPGIATFPIKGAEAPGWAWNQMWTGTTQTVGLLGKLVTPDGARKQVDRATGNGSSSASSSARGNAPGTDTSRVKSDPCAPSGDDVERPRSVIGIVQIGQCTTSNWDYVAIAGSINLALGIFNMVPLVPLDGGHATVAIYEAIASKIRRRRVYADYRKLAPVAALFITFLLFLFITSATSDVRELVR